MDREDRRRFFVIGSVFLEVVTPVFRRQIENNYNKAGFSCLADFLNNQPVVHTLFHLNHRYTWYCCVDSPNCIARQQLPLYNYQWKLLYTENPDRGKHHCHCKYTAKPVKLDDLDITLMGLILVNCLTLGPAEGQAVRALRQFKNDYLSHSTNCGITEPKYNSLWPDLTYHVIQLDPNIQRSDLEDIKNRPLDEQLCKQYFIHLVDVNKRFEEVGDSLQKMHTSVHGINTTLQGIGWNLHGMAGSVQTVNTTLQGIERSVEGGNTTLHSLERSVEGGNTTLQCLERSVEGGNTTLQVLERSVEEGNTTLQGLERSVEGGNTTLQEMNSSIQTINTAVQRIPVMDDAIQKLVYYAKTGETSTSQRQNPDIQSQEKKSYKLGQDIFYQIHQFSTVSASTIITFNKAVITNDGHVAFIQKPNCSISIYKTDGSHVCTIQQQSQPWDITVVNNSTVAVVLPQCYHIDIWDINNKQKVKSIQLSTKCYCITTINKKLVVGYKGRLLIIDPITEIVENSIDTGTCEACRLCGSGDDIFYTDGFGQYLNHYSHSNSKISKIKLTSDVSYMTTLQDGSLYVICEHESVQHVSSDGKECQQVTTKGLTSLEWVTGISYNPEQKKLIITQNDSITVFSEY